jgi:hypothetical protein
MVRSDGGGGYAAICGSAAICAMSLLKTRAANALGSFL